MFLFCLVFTMFCARLFICALWSPAGKGLTSWLSFVALLRVCHFPIGILGQVWYLIVSIPDLCTITYIYDYFRYHAKYHYFNVQKVKICGQSILTVIQAFSWVKVQTPPSQNAPKSLL